MTVLAGGAEEEVEVDEAQEKRDRLSVPPPADDTVASLLWQMLQPHSAKDCTAVQVTPQRRVVTSPLPYLLTEVYAGAFRRE